MKILKVEVPTRDFNIFLVGDKHEGSPHTHDRGWFKMVNAVNDRWSFGDADYNYVVDHGDAADGIDIRDKRYDPETVVESCREQEESAIAKRIDIKDHIIAMLMGNHDMDMWRYYGNKAAFTKMVCKRLGITYGTFSCKIHWVHKGELLFKSFHTHGRNGISSKADNPIRRWANMKLSLQRQLAPKAGDCTLMSKGHTHKLITVKPQRNLYLIDDGEKIQQKYTHAGQGNGYIHPDHRWYANTGSFLRLYADDIETVGYGETHEYDPQELGYVVAQVRGGEVVGLERVIV